MDFDTDLDIGQIREIVELCSHRHPWDIRLLGLVAEQPVRFMALKRALAAARGHGPDDKVLGDVLKRLIKNGYVRRIRVDNTQPYVATDKTCLLLSRIRRIIEADREYAAGHPDGMPAHPPRRDDGRDGQKQTDRP